MDFPPGVWITVFEQLELPISCRILRQDHVDAVRRAVRDFEAGQQNTVSQLPAFERMMWAKMHQYYNINQELRQAAEKAELSRRWLACIEHALLELPIARITVPRYRTRNWRDLGSFRRPNHSSNLQQHTSAFLGRDYLPRRAVLWRNDIGCS